MVAAALDGRFFELRAHSERYAISHFPSISAMLGLSQLTLLCRLIVSI